VFSQKLLIPIFITICLDFISIGVVLPVLTPMLLSPDNPILPVSMNQAQRTVILGFLISSFSIASFFGAPLMGAISDNIGRKKVLSCSLIISFFCYLLFAIGVSLSNIILVFTGRILAGFFAANVNTCVAAMIDITKPSDRVKNFGLIGFSSFACGYVIGPFIGSFYSNPNIVSWFSNSTPFYFIAVWSLMNLLIIKFFFKETLKVRKKEKLNPWVGITSLVKIFKYPKLLSVLMVSFLITFGFNFFDQFFQVFLIKKFSFNQFQIANMLALLGITMALTQGLVIRFVPKNIKPELILTISIPLTGILMPLLLAPSDPLYLYLIIPFISLFQGLSWPYSSVLLSNLTDDKSQGEVLGISTSLTGLAIGLPPLLSGFLAVFSINLPILIAGACSFISLLLLFYISFKQRSYQAAVLGS
jgi:MFS transporter, DHA1 family, tetracycline resistance protein